MILDNENQRKVLLELIASSAFNGKAIDEIYQLKHAIAKAELSPPAPTPPDKSYDP